MTSPQQSTAERITITNYNRCNGQYEIDTHTMPPFVCHKEFHGGAVTGLEWQEFCHVVETKLQPINRLRNTLKLIGIALLIVLLALFVFIFVGYSKDTKSYFQEHKWFELFPILLVLLAIVGIALVCYTAVVTKRAFLGIQSLCEEQSKILGTTTRANSSILVSFHLCDERSKSTLDVQTHDMAYTGNDYYHHPLRTYHNVYILAVVTMVDPENGFAPSVALPVRFPTIEFNSSNDTDDESTLGDDTLYTMGAMTTNHALRHSVKQKQNQKEFQELQVRKTAVIPDNESNKTKKSKEKAEKEPTAKKTHKKKKSKKKTGSDTESSSDEEKPKSKTGKHTSKGKKGKKKGHKAPMTGLDTITEAS